MIDNLPRLKNKRNQAIWIWSKFKTRKLFQAETEYSKKHEKNAQQKAEELSKECEFVEGLKDRYDFENSETYKELIDRKIVDYFFPTYDEIDDIRQYRKRGLEYDLETFKRDEFINILPVKDFLQNKIISIVRWYPKSAHFFA